MDTKQKYDALLIGLLVMVVAVILGIFFFLFGANRSSNLEPTAEATLATDDSWQAVQARGILYVGTSADYPPFEFYDENYQLDGFDVALMREIGERLGVQVAFSDIIFDALDESLAVGQVDTAVSALSITEERSQVVDFSNVYLVSEDAFLAPIGTTYVISTVQDVAAYRVGVQRATVFESWVRTELIATGLMPEANLLVYEKAEDAIRDLNQGRLDLVIMDILPAKEAEIANKGRIAGQGLNRQEMAMAVPKGADALRLQLNGALQRMFNDGRIYALAQQYLGIPPEQILPTPTAQDPSGTVVPTATEPSCIDGMQFIEDVNLDDNNMSNPPQMPPGTPFTKIWRIRNTGTCLWDESYALDYVGGSSSEARMSGQATAIVGSVPPNSVYDIAVNMVSPIIPGTYQGFWAMHNGAKQQFGERIWVGITILGPPTSTPAPTLTPNPAINFAVDKTELVAGQCVTFSWLVQGANAVYFYEQGENWESYPVNLNVPSRLECPATTMTYELRVAWPDGSTEIRPQPITVLPAPNAPVITSFLLNPPTQIVVDECVAISWSVTGDVDNVQLLSNGAVLWEGAPSTGNFQDCPQFVGQVSYALLAKNGGGESRAQAYLNVLPAGTAVSTTIPTPFGTPTQIPTAGASSTPAAPIIDSFWARPDEIFAGECVQLSWSVRGNASLVQLFRSGVLVGDGVGLNGTAKECLTEAGVVIYRIEASNATGANAVDEFNVTVKSALEPGLPLQNTTWTLAYYYDGVGALVAVLPGSEITAVFGANDTVTGSGGCNTYSATYQITETDLSVGALSQSGKVCSQPPGVMEQEATYTAVLRTAVTYRIVGDLLEVKDGAGALILSYKGVE